MPSASATAGALPYGSLSLIAAIKQAVADQGDVREAGGAPRTKCALSAEIVAYSHGAPRQDNAISFWRRDHCQLDGKWPRVRVFHKIVGIGFADGGKV
jgi:hypothetical protein